MGGKKDNGHVTGMVESMGPTVFVFNCSGQAQNDDKTNLLSLSFVFNSSSWDIYIEKP